jgi:hypothetical protein
MRSWKWIFILASCLLLPASAFGQTTLVTATVTDPGTIPYAGATIKAFLVDTASGIPVGSPTVTINSQAQCTAARAGTAPCQIPIQGTFQATLDNTGSIPGGGMNLSDNTQVTPTGTQWLFTITITGIPIPFGSGPQTFSVSTSISGATQSISGVLNAAAPRLTAITIGTGGTINGTIAAGQTAYGGALNQIAGGTIVLDMAGIAGADLGAKMNNCIAALPASGGTCKGDNLTGAQTLSSTVNTAKSVMFTFSGQAISQSAPITIGGGGGGINACAGASPTFTKAANIDQITGTGSNQVFSCLTLVGQGGSFTGNGIVVSGGSVAVYDDAISGEAGNGVKSTSISGVFQGNTISNGTTGAGAAMSGNGFFAFNNVTAQTGDGIDLGNAAIAYGNAIGVSITAALSGVCGINANIDQIGDRTFGNSITINDTHNGDVNYGICDTPPAAGHNLDMLFSGDNCTGILSGGATGYCFFLNNANGLNNNWSVTVENLGCIHLSSSLKRIDAINNRSTYSNIQTGDCGLDSGTGSNNDVFIWDNIPLAFASLPSPSGVGSHGYCTNCSQGRIITSTAGSGNYVHKASVAAGVTPTWIGEPLTTYTNIQFIQQSAAASSKAVTFTGNTIGGDMVVVGISCNQGAAPTLTVTDSQNNVYTAAHAIQADPVPARWIQIFEAPAIVGGPDTVTASSSVNLCTAIDVSLSEYQQVAQVSPLDGAGNSTNGNGGNPVTGGAFTVTTGDLVVGWWCNTAGGTGFAGGGFTLRGQDGTCSLEDQVAQSTSATITGASNVGNFAVMGVAFKALP